VIIKGLRNNGVEVVECQDRSLPLPIRYFRLVKKHSVLDYDVMILGVTYGQPIIPLAKMISRKPRVLDLFLGHYETEVVDRGLVNRGSLKAKAYYYLDKYAPRLADLVLCDSNTHIDYFCKEFGLKREKFRRVFVGTDDGIMYPRQSQRNDDDFLVFFYGGFIPLQGASYIVKAAKLLERQRDIKFELVGAGLMFREVKELSKKLKTNNVAFRGWVDYEKLPEHLAKADVCLGIFGNTEKAMRVIPNKVYDALAMEKPLITMNSPAAREILNDGENCVLVPMANPKALAEAILMLKDDKNLRDKIAAEGYKLFKEKLNPKAIGKELKAILTELIEKSK
jgi:glycosyltransferase involved in cell wall biosynthesis